MNNIRKQFCLAVSAMILFFTFSAPVSAQKAASSADQYFTIESYYRVKWGYADEFIQL